MTRCSHQTTAWLAVLPLLVVLLAPASVFALDPTRPIHQFIHDIWGKKAGLPQQAVNAIAQTTDGYLWLATEDGLVRFDGQKMKVFNLTNTPELGVNDIRSLIADPDGGLWIGTGQRLVRMRGGVFEDRTTVMGSPKVGVRALAFAADRALWVLTDNGVHRLSGAAVTSFTTSNGLPDARLTSVLPDGERSAWVGTMNGLARLEDGKATVLTTRQGLPHDSVFALLPTGDGGTWVGTMNGLAVVRNGRVEVPASAARLSHIQVRALLADEGGALWMGTAAGIFRLVGNRLESLTAKTGLSNDTVVALKIDREGSLWIGTMFGGLNRLRNSSIVFMDQADGLAGENVASVMEGRDRSLWIGFVDAGLDRIINGRVRHYSAADGLPNNFVRALAEAPDGTIWVGTTAGLVRLVGDRFVAAGPAEGRPHAPVAAIAIDASGSVWVGTPSGLVRLHDGRWIRYSKSDGMLTEPACAILAARSGAVWIGTDGGGLAKFEAGRFTVFDQTPGLPGGQIFDIHEDLDGVLWIGSDHGLSRYKAGSFATIDAKRGLFSDTIFRILDDRAGNFWMSSNIGVAKVEQKQLNDVADGRAALVTSLVFSSDAGTKDAECNGAVQPAGWRAADGRLWFSASAGAAVIDPKRIWLNTAVPPVVLDELTLGEQPVALVRDLKLPAGRQEIRFAFGAPSFISPERVEFKYRLDGPGSEAEWHSGSSRDATFLNLGPGIYTFRVVAANADGVWNNAGASIRFEKLPLFYQTWWFYGLCVVLCGSVVLGTVYWRLREHAERERELTRRVDEAMATIKTLHGLLPICAWCKKVRNDAGSWEQIEVYVRNHTDATFSHGICPDCRAKVEADIEA
jgi:ligand-binding sensor domain-containing protein